MAAWCPHILIGYDAARERILDGDVLLWRPTSLMGRAIRFGSKQQYSHASMAGWCRPAGNGARLRNIEMTQWYGGRSRPLSEQVALYPGKIDVWRPNDPYDGAGAVKQMLWLCGQHYGWSDFAAMTVRIVLPNIALPTPIDCDDPDIARVCSPSVSYAARTGGGRKPRAGLPDLWTKPGDLAHPEFATYQFTLIP